MRTSMRVHGMLALALLAGALAAAAPQPARAAVVPTAVVALIDTGVNPYNQAFRDPSPLAYQHPSTYIPGYPADAEALPISLDEPDLATALAKDAEVWLYTGQQRLYWIPGTRIVGMIAFGNGGLRCNPLLGQDWAPFNSFGGGPGCRDKKLTDEHGHGTMTASRAAGAPNSLGGDPAYGSQARIVAIEGLGSLGVMWAADQGWIDVQSNSWAELLPHPAPTGTYDAFRIAAQKMVVVAASGNGLGGIAGFAPNSTYALTTAAPGVIVAGAHDNGRISHWSGAPPTVVADGYGGYMAYHNSITAYGPDSVACCTSAAAPYVAGGAVRLVLEARRILGSSQVGIQGGIVAQAASGVTPPASGPLSDGALTLAELTALLRATAEARPAEGRDDGLLLYTGDPRAPTQQELSRGPASNPYCNGCMTLPVGWSAIPQGVPAYPTIGYGAINERSVGLAIDVMEGEAAMPARPIEDAFFAADQAAREATNLP